MQVSKATIQKLAPLIGMKRKKKGEYSLQLAPATTEAEAMVARAEHDAEIAGLEAIGVQQIRAREQQPTDHAPDVQQQPGPRFVAVVSWFCCVAQAVV